MVKKESESIDDTYARVAEAVNRVLMNKTATLSGQSASKSIWRNTLWVYVIAPAFSALLSLGIGAFLLWDKSYIWLALLIGELLAVNLSISGIAFELFSQKKQAISYLAGVSIFVVIIFSPWAASQILFSTLIAHPIPVAIACGITIVMMCFTFSAFAAGLTSTIETIKATFSDFASTYISTVGRPANRAVAVALRVVLQETHNGEDSKELEYLQVAAQAMIDSSGTRVLPWLVLLTMLSFGFDSLFDKVFVSKTSLLGSDTTSMLVSILVPAIRLGAALGVMYFAFNVAHRTYIDVAILQAVSKIKQKFQA